MPPTTAAATARYETQSVPHTRRTRNALVGTPAADVQPDKLHASASAEWTFTHTADADRRTPSRGGSGRASIVLVSRIEWLKGTGVSTVGGSSDRAPAFCAPTCRKKLKGRGGGWGWGLKIAATSES